MYEIMEGIVMLESMPTHGSNWQPKEPHLRRSAAFTRTNVGVQHSGRFQWHPEPSGLIGPVRLVGRER
jgi:hypothetical protein